MRVTEGVITEKYIFNQNRINQKMLELQSQLTSNKKVENLSDNVGAALDIVSLDSKLNKFDSYKKNIDNAKNFINSSINSFDNAISNMEQIIQKVETMDDAINKENYPTIIKSIKDSVESIVRSLNEKHNGMYLFGGTNYSQEPFSFDADGKIVLNSADAGGELKVKVGSNFTETINISGDKINNSGLISSLNAIMDKLNNGEAPTKVLKDTFTEGYNGFLALQTQNGEKINRLDDIGLLLENNTTNTQNLLVDKQAIDPAKLIVDLQYQDYLLQMSNKLSATILPKSLLDYI
ncbi:MAG: hypothetical protein WC055_04980 [Melioribacteraceae bacterium]